MKEEDLRKAMELKDELDSERQLLRFANFPYVDLRVNLEERCDHGHIRNINDVLGDNFIKELKAKVIANIEKNISDLLDKLEKL